MSAAFTTMSERVFEPSLFVNSDPLAPLARSPNTHRTLRCVVNQIPWDNHPYPERMHLSGWSIEHTVGSAGAFHDRPPPAPLRPTIWIHQVDRPALVLGSTQRAPLLDVASAEQAGIEVCQRRSGGGLVYVDPDTSLWIDVIVPRGHPLWSDDIGLAFNWVGETWASALASTGLTDLTRVHTGRLMHPDWGRVICFAGLGPGEVVVGGRKVVGLSQRRTREMARFQGLAVSELAAPTIRRHLQPGALPADLDHELDELPVGAPLDLDALPEAFIASLPVSN